MYGNVQAMIKSTMPNPNFGLFSSNDPDITNNIAKNPKIIGRI